MFDALVPAAVSYVHSLVLNSTYVSRSKAVSPQVFAATKNASTAERRRKSLILPFIRGLSRDRFPGEPSDYPRVSIPILTSVLNPFSGFYFVWSLILIAVNIVYAAVLEPLFIAFKTPLTTLDSWAPIFDLVAGSIYCADVIINARTGWRVTHKSRSKLTLDDRQSLLFFAQTSYCWLALLALVPWILQIIFTITTDADGDVSWNESTINALQVLRLLRLVSLLMNFSRSKRTRDLIETNITRYVDAYFVYCCMLLALLLFATHLFACAWIFVASLEGFENSWIADVNGEDYIDKGQGAIYSAAFYFATQTFTSVGYGNIAATTVAEQWVATVGMVFGAFFFAFVTGQFAVVITTLVDSYEEDLKEKITLLHKWMNRQHLDHGLRREVTQYYYQHYQIERGDILKTVTMVSQMPAALKIRVVRELLQPTLDELLERECRSLDIWESEASAEAAIDHICAMMEPLMYPAGSCIYFSGDSGDAAYILRVGRVELRSGLSTAPSLRTVNAALREGSQIRLSKSGVDTRRDTQYSEKGMDDDRRETGRERQMKEFRLKKTNVRRRRRRRRRRVTSKEHDHENYNSDIGDHPSEEEEFDDDDYEDEYDYYVRPDTIICGVEETRQRTAYAATNVEVWVIAGVELRRAVVAAAIEARRFHDAHEQLEPEQSQDTDNTD